MAWGRNAKQTYVEQIRVCVFPCHRHCAGLSEPLMRPWFIHSNSKALKSHFTNDPPNMSEDIYDELTWAIKIAQKWSPIMPPSLCCQQRIAAEDWLGWKVEKAPALNKTGTLSMKAGISAVSLCNYLQPPALCSGLPCLLCASRSLAVLVTLSSSLPLSPLKSLTCLSPLMEPTLKEEA